MITAENAPRLKRLLQLYPRVIAHADMLGWDRFNAYGAQIGPRHARAPGTPAFWAPKDTGGTSSGSGHGLLMLKPALAQRLHRIDRRHVQMRNLGFRMVQEVLSIVGQYHFTVKLNGAAFAISALGLTLQFDAVIDLDI